MKISGFLLVAGILTLLYLWRTGNLGVVTPAPAPKVLAHAGDKFGAVAP